jgi:transmembrane sensor
MNTTDEDILITKMLAGEASAEDANALTAWRNANSINNDKFIAMQKIWHTALQDEVFVDTDAAWQKVQSNIKTQNTSKQINYSMYLRIAASLLLFSIIGWLGYSVWYNPLITVQTASAEIKQVSLPDGSVIWLNEQSKISYRKKLNGNQRQVQLDGEAFFEVVKNPERPFIIEAPQTVTRVLGTSFNLSARLGQIAELNVLTGKVSFSSTQTHDETIVNAGEKAIINSKGATQKSSFVSENVIAWKNRKLFFKDAMLKEVIEQLEKYFHVTIEIENRELLNCRFTGEFINPKLPEVLDVLSKSLQLSISNKQNGRILIKGKGCEA